MFNLEPRLKGQGVAGEGLMVCCFLLIFRQDLVSHREFRIDSNIIFARQVFLRTFVRFVVVGGLGEINEKKLFRVS